MALFSISEIFEPIKEKDFKLEKEIQELTENNLKTIFGFDFIRSEFSLNNFRIDTLAYDKENKSFVIIEYKRDKNFSIVDQGYAYLSLMLNNKADFILEYNDNKNTSLKRDNVDWTQSKVVFISPGFTAYQKEAINFKDLPIELWEIKLFENQTVSYEQIKKVNAKESIKTVSRKNEDIEKVSKEIKVYTESEHLKWGSDEIKELYEKLRTNILNFGDIEVKPKKYYIAFTSRTNIVDFNIKKRSIKIWINLSKGELDDPKKISRDVSNIGHWGNGDYEIEVSSDDDLEYIMSLIKQSLKKNKR